MRWWAELVIVALALAGLWVTVDKTAAGIGRLWAWLRRDRVSPLLEDESGCECCEDADADYEGAPVCGQCGHPAGWHLPVEELPPERSAEALGFTPETLREHVEALGGTFEPARPRTFLERLEAKRERLASAAELEHRAAYEAMGLDYPSGLMARVRELTP